MKRVLLMISLTMLLNVAFSQSNLNQTISRACQLIGVNSKNMQSYLNNGGYTFTEKNNNFYTYIKTNDGLGYAMVVAFRNDRVSALSWKELSYNSIFLKNEVENLGFTLTTNTTLGNKIIRNYQNLKRNLMVTLILDEAVVTINMGIKDPNKPFSTANGVSSKSTSLNNSIISVDYWLSPKDNNSKILSKASPKAVHSDWLDGQIGLGWGFRARKKL